MKQSPGTTVINIVQSFRDMDLGESLYSPAQRRAVRSSGAALTDDGRVTSEAIADLHWDRVTWYLPTPATGANVEAMHPMPQGCTIRQVMIHAKTPPSSGQFLITINTGTGAPTTLSLQSSELTASTAMVVPVPPGGVLTLTVQSASDATGVTITVFTAPYGGS